MYESSKIWQVPDLKTVENYLGYSSNVVPKSVEIFDI